MNEDDDIIEPDEEEALLDEEEQASGPSDEAVDPDFERKKSRRLTDAEKAELLESYELGTLKVSELAAKYDITRQAVYQIATSRGIKHGARAHEIAAAAAAAQKQTAVQVERYAQRRLDWIEETRSEGYLALKRISMLTNKLVADSVKAGVSPSSKDDDYKALHRLTRLLGENYETRLRILDADNVVDEKDLPKLVIDDLTAEKIVEFHKQQGIENPEELEEILASFEEPIQ